MSADSLLFPARLGSPPNRVYAGDGEFRENRQQWLQPPDLWTLIYYHHRNVVTINARTFPVSAESVAIFAPGVRGGHTRIGDTTPHMFVSFNLPAAEGRRSAIPAYVPDGPIHFPMFRRAVDRISSDGIPATTFSWQFMSFVSLDASLLRDSEALYAAEEYILRHLGDDLRVPDIAEFAKVSPRQLLRMMREEHRLTVQEFVRKKRAQEACRLLSTTSKPIKLVAQQVGIPDLAQFNKLLKAETGAPPRVFREMALSRKS